MLRLGPYFLEHIYSKKSQPFEFLHAFLFVAMEPPNLTIDMMACEKKSFPFQS